MRQQNYNPNYVLLFLFLFIPIYLFSQTASVTEGCFPLQVQFDPPSSAATFFWDFKNGSTSVASNPTTIFNLPGTYVVEFRESMGQPIEGFITIEVFSPPELSIVTDPVIPNVCVGTAVNFNGEISLGGDLDYTFSWDFGNGEMASTAMASSTYNTTGTFQVNLAVGNAAPGCQAAAAIDINVQDFPQADFITSIDNDAVVCAPKDIVFEDNSQSNFNVTQFWNFGSGQTGVGELDTAFFTKGTFDVTLIVATSYGCSDTITKPVTLDGPEGDFSVDPILICPDNPITFTLEDTVDISSVSWDFGDGNMAGNEGSVEHTYIREPASGEVMVTLTLRGQNDLCVLEVTKPVRFGDVVADFIPNDGVDTILCSGIPYSFINTSIGADSFIWDFANDSGSIEEDPSTTYEEEGDYLVRLIAEASEIGCRDTIDKLIMIRDIPPVTIQVSNPDMMICRGEEFSVSVTDAQPNWIYGWLPLEAFDDPSSAMPTVSLDTETDLIVVVRDSSGCETGARLTVPIEPCVDYQIPNIFSPNGDGENERFTVFTNGTINQDIEIMEFKVFSRWGQLVYDNERPLEGWDGTFNGNALPADIYAYYIKLRVRADGRIEDEIGDVTLLR